jgi:Protein of unknown function (DUF1592)
MPTSHMSRRACALALVSLLYTACEGQLAAPAGPTSFTRGIELALEALLAAPSFMYRRELGAPHTRGGLTLTPHELASALPFMLTDAPPDDALRAAADSGHVRALPPAFPRGCRRHPGNGGDDPRAEGPSIDQLFQKQSRELQGTPLASL